MILSVLFISISVVSNFWNTTMTDHFAYEIRYTSPRVVDPDSLLNGIEEKIYHAFLQGVMTQNINELAYLDTQLKRLHKDGMQNLTLYWRSYIQFYSSIYHLKSGNKKDAEQHLEKAINWMLSMQHKTSEDYALLAMLQGFAIQFSDHLNMSKAKEIKRHATLALALDSANLRACYVYASNDFYTPKEYGGGKEAEKYLIKAISLKEQEIKNDCLPSWGKEESYDLLIKVYIRQKKWDLAKKYLQQGINAYPDSYILNQLALQLVDK